MMRRMMFLLPAGFALLAGLNAALLLLGLPAPVTTARLPDVHGILLTLGFVGTVIALERAVALKRRAGFLAPGLLGAGAVVLLSPAPLAVGQGMLAAGMAALTLVYIPLWRRQHDDSVLIQLLGGVLGTGAALLWWGGASMPDVLPWLATFVILTIAGERLELARVAFLSARADGQVLLIALSIAAGTIASLLWPTPGYILLGAGILALCAWLATHDVAKRTIHAKGLPRFMAACLLAGYVWLTIAGLIWLLGGAARSGIAYDGVIHAVFLGFTISMIMAHAPVILPAVLRIKLPYHPIMYVPAATLHATLLLRVGVGDLRGLPTIVKIGGVGNIVALLMFVALMLGIAIRANARSARSAPRVPSPATADDDAASHTAGSAPREPASVPDPAHAPDASAAATDPAPARTDLEKANR